MKIKIFSSFLEVSEKDWNSLWGVSLFTSHEFLSSLELSGCASERTGWKLQILTAWEGDALVGAMPLYFKSHSYGEFVFDWAWADAYRQNGLSYYPKLICASPFTPITGKRVLGNSAQGRELLRVAALELAAASKASSFHCLFPDLGEVEEWKNQKCLLRKSVQFHWENKDYRDFASFLAQMRHDKRKKINQERRKVKEAGISFQRLRGAAITPDHLHFFMECYRNTHEQYGSPMSLNLEFFLRLHRLRPDNLLLILAVREEKWIGAAFNLIDGNCLYGRSWGAIESHPALHFEACYYQAIEFCIENNFQVFEGGAQGEHKMARGFLPVTTWSAHWLEHPEFFRAIEDFLQNESHAIDEYQSELGERVPFKE